jgi:hypothetical protein
MHFFLNLFLQAQLGGALPPDSVDSLRDRARRAEARFERLARERAPHTWRTFSGSNCDEIVGRFCLRFDSTVSPPSRAEDGAIARARREAVESMRRYFSAAPGDRTAAGPLVRVLITDGRAAEAVPAARTFAALSADSLWGDLLLGTALHANGVDDEAELHFARALARMDPPARGVWLDPEWLLDHDERQHVRRLDAYERADYERRFWRLADPFWMTPANELWVEHMARHTQTRLLAEVPRVTDMLRWGRDLDELTIRYGTPVARSRTEPGRLLEQRGSLVEYWDSTQRAYAPAQLSAGVPPPPAPGERPPLYAARARSAYAYGPVHRVLELDHQATRFLGSDGAVLLRVDGRVIRASAAAQSITAAAQSIAAADSVRRAATVASVGLFAYDTTFGPMYRTTAEAPWIGDTARLSLILPVPEGRIVYSAEVLDSTSGVAARARYGLDVWIPEDGPVVSDILVSRPFPSGPLPERLDDPVIDARSSLVLAAGDTLGIYAEAYRLQGGTLGVELALESDREPSLLSRFGRWIGRAVGVARPDSEPRVAWRTEQDNVIHTVALNLPLERRMRGPYSLVLRITDLSSGAVTETRRQVLIVDGEPAG